VSINEDEGGAFGEGGSSFAHGGEVTTLATGGGRCRLLCVLVARFKLAVEGMEEGMLQLNGSGREVTKNYGGI